MKIGVISDIHKGYNEFHTGEDITALYIEELRKRAIEVLIIAGDLDEDIVEVKAFIDKVRNELKIIVLYVPGNHEMWDGKKKPTHLRYQEFVNQIEGNLCGKPYHLNDDWAVVGAMGWYDYGFKIPYVTDQIVARKKKKIWANEYNEVNLQISDQEFAAGFVEQVEKEIKQLSDKRIIFVNHFILFEPFLTIKENNDWNFANAFMGSKSMGGMLLKYPNVKMAIFGHTHKRFGMCDYKDLKVICNPLGYVGEWKTKDIKTEIEQSIIEFNLEDIK